MRLTFFFTFCFVLFLLFSSFFFFLCIWIIYLFIEWLFTVLQSYVNDYYFPQLFNSLFFDALLSSSSSSSKFFKSRCLIGVTLVVPLEISIFYILCNIINFLTNESKLNQNGYPMLHVIKYTHMYLYTSQNRVWKKTCLK